MFSIEHTMHKNLTFYSIHRPTDSVDDCWSHEDLGYELS